MKAVVGWSVDALRVDRDTMQTVLLEGSLAVYEGQMAGSDSHRSRGHAGKGRGGRLPKLAGWKLPAIGSGSAQMDRHERRFRCTFPSKQQQIRELYISETKFSGRMPQTTCILQNA